MQGGIGLRRSAPWKIRVTGKKRITQKTERGKHGLLKLPHNLKLGLLLSAVFLSVSLFLKPALAEEVWAKEMPAKEAAFGAMPAGETASGEMPTGETASGAVAAGETASGETPTGETASGVMQTGEAAADTKDVFQVLFPTNTEDVFDFIMDPQELIAKTHAAAYGNLSFQEGANLFFRRHEEGAQADYTSSSDSLVITNLGTADVELVVTASISPESLGVIAMTGDESFVNDGEASLYLALTDGEHTVPIDREAGAVIRTILAGAEAEGGAGREYRFWLVGGVNPGGDWSEIGGASPKVTVTWSAKALEKEEPEGSQSPEKEETLPEGSVKLPVRPEKEGKPEDTETPGTEENSKGTETPGAEGTSKDTETPGAEETLKGTETPEQGENLKEPGTAGSGEGQKKPAASKEEGNEKEPGTTGMSEENPEKEETPGMTGENPKKEEILGATGENPKEPGAAEAEGNSKETGTLEAERNQRGKGTAGTTEENSQKDETPGITEENPK